MMLVRTRYDLVRIPVDVTYVDSVESVWVIKTSDKPALEEIMDKLANLRDELAPVVEICEEDVVIAMSSDDEFYRGKVVSIKNKLALCDNFIFRQGSALSGPQLLGGGPYH